MEAGDGELVTAGSGAAAPTTIRDASPADWPGIWSFMRSILAAGETYCWPVGSSEDDARAWWMSKPYGRVFVAVATGGEIIGTAEVHPNQPAQGSHVAGAGFMVSPAAAGCGVGRALAEHVIEAARADGYVAMQFNAVVETNAAAVALWKSLGFAVLATIPRAYQHPAFGLVGLHVMHRKL
nr:GNAT family N-acetyltransferase [Rarobacter faecitabidus]